MNSYPHPPQFAAPQTPRTRPWWRRLLPWITAVTLLPFITLALGLLLDHRFHCNLTGDPPTGSPCITHGMDIEPVTALLEDTGEGALLTIFLVPVVAAGWISVLVLHVRSRKQ
ncbi:hypothetical protein [Terriglobus sp.]|uniref:hypothetical protein n=1 Tax=Terriglobus sp. TaxID=1889013 RepID=UPI003B00E633